MIAEKQNILGFNVSIKEAIKAIYLLIKHCNQDEIGTPEKHYFPEVFGRIDGPKLPKHEPARYKIFSKNSNFVFINVNNCFQSVSIKKLLIWAFKSIILIGYLNRNWTT